MLDYEYHYPLTPIQSESHNIHPAFRNDPELTSIVNLNESLTSLVPPPRNPLRTAVKPLFFSTSEEINTPALSPVNTLDSREDSILNARPADSATVDPFFSSESSRPLTARTSTSKTFHKDIRGSTAPPHYEESGEGKGRPESQDSTLRHSSPTQRQARQISTLTAPTLSSLPCPPSLVPEEWSLFLHDLQSAAALSKGQKSLAIVVALAVPIPFPAFKGLIGWGLWRYQMTKNVRLGLENSSAFEKKRGRESVESVVKRWNEGWKKQRVRVNLEVRGKGKRARGEKGNFKVIVTKLRAPQVIDESSEKDIKI